MMQLTDPRITINAEGTLYQTRGGLTDQVASVYDPEEQVSRSTPLKVLSAKGSSLTAFFVKFHMCMNVTGTTASPGYIVSDINMKEGAIDCYEVPGLAIGTEVDSSGYNLFAKTRAVNESFYR